MTAEVGILNRNGLALAADSAVTIGGGQKIYASANKIFSLSKYHPIGIMIYGNASLLNMPWETIIKSYRKALNKSHFDYLEDYCKHFLNYLESDNGIINEETQDQYAWGTIHNYLLGIKKSMEDQIDDLIKQHNAVTTKQIKQSIKDTLDTHYNVWTDSNTRASNYSDEYIAALKARYVQLVIDSIPDIFESLPLTKKQKDQIQEIAVNLFANIPEQLENVGSSGVVIAGYGEKEFLPHLYEYKIDGLTLNKLKYKTHTFSKVGVDTEGSIIPFAQSEMVATFMEGIDPSLDSAIRTLIYRLLHDLPQTILGRIDNIDEDQRKELSRSFQSDARRQISKYVEEIEKVKRENYINPITQVVSVLPKEELAEMAEALVNLTSFKRKISWQPETVGGPIDVAVISKGDGFVWIKRKHYFKPELNPHFFANYFEKPSE